MTDDPPERTRPAGHVPPSLALGAPGRPALTAGSREPGVGVIVEDSTGHRWVREWSSGAHTAWFCAEHDRAPSGHPSADAATWTWAELIADAETNAVWVVDPRPGKADR